MTGDRQARIHFEIEVYRAALWIYANRDHILPLAGRNRVHAVWFISDGAGVSEDAATTALDARLLDSRDWRPSFTAVVERAIADLETWLQADPDDPHPAVKRALAPILAEFASTGGPVFRFEHEPTAPGENLEVIAYEPGGIGTGLWVDPLGADEDNIQAVSGVMYDAAVEATHNAWPKEAPAAAWLRAHARYADMDNPTARFNTQLLEALRPRWQSVVRPDTSMFTLLFTRPDRTGYDYDERVSVLFESADRVRIEFERTVARRGEDRLAGPITVAGDFTRPENAYPAVEAMLLQLQEPQDLE